MGNKLPVPLPVLYVQDYPAWTQQTIATLQSGKFSELDIAHLIEELGEMGNSHRMELVNRLRILLAHLLKWQYQYHQLSERWKESNGSSWRSKILEQRDSIQWLLEEYPSLRSYFSEAVSKAYPAAVRLTGKETKLPVDYFPIDCPYMVSS